MHNRKYLLMEVNADLSLSLVGQSLHYKIYNPQNVGLKAIKPKDAFKAARSVSLSNHFFKYICDEKSDEDYDTVVNALVNFFSADSLNGFDNYLKHLDQDDTRTSINLFRDYVFDVVRKNLLRDNVLELLLDYVEHYTFATDFEEDAKYGSILRLEDIFIFTIVSIVHKFISVFIQLMILDSRGLSASVNKTIKTYSLLNTADIVESFISDKYPNSNSSLKFVERVYKFISSTSERNVLKNTTEIASKFSSVGSDADTIIDSIFKEVILSTGTFSVRINYNNEMSAKEEASIVASEKEKYMLEAEASESAVVYDEAPEYDEDGNVKEKKEVITAAKLPYRIGLNEKQFGFNAKNTVGYIQTVRTSATNTNTVMKKFKVITDTYDGEIHHIIQANESIREDKVYEERLDEFIFSKVIEKFGESTKAKFDEFILTDRIKPNSLSRFIIRQVILEQFGVSLSRMSYKSQVAYIMYATCLPILEKKENLVAAMLGGEQHGSINSNVYIDFSGTPIEFNEKARNQVLALVRRGYVSSERGKFIPADGLAIEMEYFIRGI